MCKRGGGDLSEVCEDLGRRGATLGELPGHGMRAKHRECLLVPASVGESKRGGRASEQASLGTGQATKKQASCRPSCPR